MDLGVMVKVGVPIQAAISVGWFSVYRVMYDVV